MRIARVLIVASACAVALFTSFLTIMISLSRFANSLGTPGDLYLGIAVGALGLIGGFVVLLLPDLGAAILFVSAALVVSVTTPNNALPTVLYIAGGLLAFFAYRFGRIAAGRDGRV